MQPVNVSRPGRSKNRLDCFHCHAIKKIHNKSQIVFGQSDCFRTPFFRCIKQVACLFRLISNFDTSSLINKLKSRYFWLIKQEKLLIKQERWHFMFIKHVTFA